MIMFTSKGKLCIPFAVSLSVLLAGLRKKVFMDFYEYISTSCGTRAWQQAAFMCVWSRSVRVEKSRYSWLQFCVYNLINVGNREPPRNMNPKPLWSWCEKLTSEWNEERSCGGKYEKKLQHDRIVLLVRKKVITVTTWAYKEIKWLFPYFRLLS